MDFYKILESETKDRNTKKDVLEIFPDFQVTRSEDLMIRGKKFYAVWDETKGLWSTDEYDVQRLVDADLKAYADKVRERGVAMDIKVRTLGNFGTGLWTKFQQYTTNLADNSTQLDSTITFADTKVEKGDYVSRRTSYELSPGGSIESFREILDTLYDEIERRKLIWAIGAILSGDARNIQKFIVLYGPPGAGKGTLLKLVEFLFDGYIAAFEAKALTSNSNAFSTEVFRDNPLVAIQHDGDLSRIEDNSKLNSIVSHEDMIMNEKYKSSYTSRINAFLMMGTNKAVKMTDAKSGLLRRLIDVHPSGRKIPERRYHILMNQVQFELGAIASYCLTEYQAMGRDYYSAYRPVDMMLKTDVFYNYIEYFYDVFSEDSGITLSHAFTLYKQYCQEAHIEYRLSMHIFREELKNYFKEYHARLEVDGVYHRNYYRGFIDDNFKPTEHVEPPKPVSLILEETTSLLDAVLAEQPAQYSKTDGSPTKYWSANERMIRGVLRVPDESQVCSTVLRDVDTSKEHYVKPPLNHIVIDFDLKDETGQKSMELNLAEASKWPLTYAEFSKGGSGVHLHYIYDGDVSELSRIYADDIEVKVFVGDSSLRRRLSRCNAVPITTISGGLPLREKKMISDHTIQDEKNLRALLAKILRKEVHSGTKPSMDFIKRVLDDAYASGLAFDVTDLRPAIITFAHRSTNQSLYCLKLANELQYLGKVSSDERSLIEDNVFSDAEELVVFDCEVFPNLFVLNWMYQNQPESMVRMINPSPEDVARVIKLKLVGFNCRRYDNHILMGRIMGESNYQLYQRSKKLIGNDPSGYIGEAFNLSYADIYDFAATKKGLKAWQIELGINHVENEIPWDDPVPEHKWPEVVAYCDNDVISTGVVLEHLDADFNARKILASLSGLSVNQPTKNHAAKIIFEGDREPQGQFVYTDLSERFPGYTFELGKSSYKDVDEVGEGGYVYAEPGMYENVGVLDVTSMHPTSMVQLNLFGGYTSNFHDLIKARVFIKRGELDAARQMFGGALAPYLNDDDPESAEKLSYALKIIINTVYGLTCARFTNPFKDSRNKDNIVAKRGALFMIDLKEFVESHGYQVVHIKTDSIKIVDIDSKIIDLVMEFAAEYGYEFEHEATYDKFCLINDAVYIADVRAGRKPRHWEAIGAQFKHPYVFKKLFSKEPIDRQRDLPETKQVTTSMYLDFTPESDVPMALMPENPDPENLKFVGRAGSFLPVSSGGGYLLRKDKEGVKLSAVTGSSGHQWLEAADVNNELAWAGIYQNIDYTYYNNLAEKAIDAIQKFGDFEWFVGDSFAAETVAA